MSSKNYSNTLLEHLFLTIIVTAPTVDDTSKKLDLYLNDVRLSVVTLAGFPLFIYVLLF